jgi:hypothetical protein
MNMDGGLHDLNKAMAAVALSDDAPADHDELHHEHLALRPILDILKLSEPRDLLSMPKDLIVSAIGEARLPLDGAAAVHVALGKLHPAAGGQHADTEHRTTFALIEGLIRKMPDSASLTANLTSTFKDLIAKMPDPTATQRAQDKHHLDTIERQQNPYIDERNRVDKLFERAEATYAADPIKALVEQRRTFLASCKAHALTPFEVIVGQWTLYVEHRELGQYLLTTILLHPLPADRIKLHNWYVVRGKGQHYLHSFGAAVMALTVPLFPFTESDDFLELNNILLQNALSSTQSANGSAISGGGPSGIPQKIKELYRLDDSSQILGGGYLHVMDAQGIQTGIVDTTPFEAWVVQVCDERANKTELQLKGVLTSVHKCKDILNARLQTMRSRGPQSDRPFSRDPHNSKSFRSNHAAPSGPRTLRGGEGTDSGNETAPPPGTGAAGPSTKPNRV